MTDRKLISSGSSFEREAGYSRAVILGNMAFVSGTTGYDYETMTMPDSVREQTANALATIGMALEEGSFGMTDVVRMTYYVTQADFASELFEETGRVFAEIRPAATLIVGGLLKPEMKVEIEATALKV